MAISYRTPRPSRKNQIIFVIFWICVTVVWQVGYYFLSQADSVTLFDYQGTSGPLALLLGPGGEYDPRGPIYTIRPGGVFGWISTLCVHPGVSGLAVNELVL